MLAKTGVHHYSGNNIELGTACGKYYRVCTLAIIDPGMPLLQCSDRMAMCQWFLCSPVSSSTEQVTCRGDDTFCCPSLSGLTLNYSFFWPRSCSSFLSPRFSEPGITAARVCTQLLLLWNALSVHFVYLSVCNEVLVAGKQLYGTCFWAHQLEYELVQHAVYVNLNLRQRIVSCPASQNDIYKNNLYAGGY